MKEFRNDNFIVVINGSEVTVTNKFGDKYVGIIDENGKVVAKSAFGLKYIMRAKAELNF